ncbi:6-hydroxymethylpterin diphosphokinase MptE-like protein [Pseudoalteromonas sp. A757]|uniref:motility associated factor glycosyltransferase family protein n=1 Tax=Pseudoalteromonas sp. A757 TaxID=2250709 RepID=UPI000FFEAF7A|nr:6-hydroxymethylpterin diphosphokinase MptE-like protein [Pseudoalteromonas sp. A757]RXE84891.1 hypothetical protein DRB05_18225 [Pseudoalteromonas sp. A757]
MKASFQISQNKSHFPQIQDKLHAKSIELEFYGIDPKVQCIEQVELFFNRPTHLSLNLSIAETQYYHQQFINKSHDIASALGFKPNSKPTSSTLVVLGLGAGYHVPALLNKLNYIDVIIIEQDQKLEALGRFNIDLETIKNECKARGGNLKLFKCKSYSDFLDSLASYSSERSCGIFSDISLFRHYNCQLFDKIYDSFKEWRNSFVSLWGFMEDEMISLKHSYQNIKSLKNFKKSDFSFLESHKALIVGNGPSLDLIIDDINKFNGIIVSCGTSLSSLLKKDIVPHIHVEMERSRDGYYIKENYLNSPLLKNTLLITLNTVYHKTLRAFKNRLVFFKANDITTEIITKEHAITPLYYSNPTVTNTAMSALVSLGVKKFVLSGCDYGFVDEKLHHCKHSQYYNERDDLSRCRFTGQHYVQGNQTERVLTTRIFNESRKAVESLIHVNPELSVENISNGALINGAIPTKELKQNSIPFSFSLFENSFKAVNNLNHISFTFKKNLDRCREILNFVIKDLKKTRTLNELKSVLSNFISDLESNPNEREVMLVLSGSFKYIIFGVFNHTNHIPEDKKEDYFLNIKPILCEIVTKIKTEILSIVRTDREI